jgi:hypothetical protein
VKTYFGTIFLAVLVLAVFMPMLARSANYVVGVRGGDWVKYGQVTVNWNGTGTEPGSITEAKKMIWVRLDILSVVGTTVSLNSTLHFSNGTEISQSESVDVNDGRSMSGMGFVIASNLMAGDPITPETPEATINETVTGEYAGASRKVNVVHIVVSSGEIRDYWDQSTGVMVEYYFKQPDYSNPGAYEEASVKATETNMWTTGLLGPLSDYLIYIVVGAVAVVIIIVGIIAFRRRKPPPPVVTQPGQEAVEQEPPPT